MTGTSILLATTFAAAFSGPSIAAAQNAARWEGFYAGLGVEAAVSSNISVRAEYNFMTLEEDTPFFAPPGSEFDIEGFSAGFSFRF